MEVTGPAPVVVFKKRGAKAKASSMRKRPATPPPAASDSDYSSSSSEDESGQRVKRRRKNKGAVMASSRDNNRGPDRDLAATVFTADRNASLTSSNDATRIESLRDEAGALSSKELLGSTRSMPTPADGTYKGLANQTTFIQRNPDAPNRTFGPIKAAASNIRTITVTDFAPDVCKE